MNTCLRILAAWIPSIVLCQLSIHAVAFVPASSNPSPSSRYDMTAIPSSYSRSRMGVPGPDFSRGVALESTTIVGEDGMANSTAEETISRIDALFPGAEVLTIEVTEHVPLGCTVEESLHEADDSILISKLTKEGNAEKAGLKVGDVIVGVTGLFGELTSTIDLDVEKIKRLVSAVAEEDPLTIKVARGTEVLERHESALVELCNLSDGNDKEVEDCVVNFLAGGFDYENDIPSDDEVLCADTDAEGLIDGMMNLWADELPPPPTTSGITDQTNQRSSAQKPKPWSNRSSPSGTWVRDPKTGKMRNIDK
eukprot:CAMPEP_0172363390 /NCGR_PEP_ID=MMETSP1060-20121228/6763_1 /TAXON_ID=37318 /ORGANISM="Pseudo-nitzschia pungens, Strain cf. cingulata" /LENGTH=308 /DNA_ID=CAMNT_0013086119 /DNA_START=1137 /DNA_END=2063 /DNA_ORIENTATION=-